MQNVNQNKHGLANVNPKKEKKPFKEVFWSRKGQRNFWGYTFVAPALIIFVLFTVLPIILSFTLGFTNIKSPASSNYKFTGLANFRFLFNSNPSFWKGMKNILLYTVITVPLTLTGSMILALIVKKPIAGTKFFRGVFYLPGITSGVATAMVWSYLLNGTNGIINQGIAGINNLFGFELIPKILLAVESTALWGIILMTLWGALGGNMVLFLAGMNSIPTSIFEAAEVDGANRFQTFFRVTLPMMKPSIFFALTLSLIGTPQMFEPIILMNARTVTPVYEIYKNAMDNGMMSLAIAQSIVLFAFIMMITFVMQKTNKESYI